MLMNLRSQLEKAAHELGVQIDFDYSVEIDPGKTLTCVGRLRNFGAAKGMLIVSSFQDVRDRQSELARRGYGYSVLSDKMSEYDRESTVEMLADWGWTGPIGEQPLWLDERAGSPG
jgi:hypothetical protein